MKKIPKIWLLVSIGLLATSASCEKRVTPLALEKVIVIQSGKSTKIEFNRKNYTFYLKSVSDERVPDCNLLYGALIPAKLTIEVDFKMFSYDFYSCKPTDELTWDEIEIQPESHKVVVNVDEHTIFRVSKVNSSLLDKTNFSAKLILRYKP